MPSNDAIYDMEYIELDGTKLRPVDLKARGVLVNVPRFLKGNLLVSPTDVPCAGEITYTATKDCCVFANLRAYNSESSYMKFSADGTNYINVGESINSGSTYVVSTHSVYLKAGDSVKISSPNHGNSVYWVAELL